MLVKSVHQSLFITVCNKFFIDEVRPLPLSIHQPAGSHLADDPSHHPRPKDRKSQEEIIGQIIPALIFCHHFLRSGGLLA